MLQALSYRTRGEIPTALVALERALTLAEPEGYVRVFVDEGQPMAALLGDATQRPDRPDLRPPHTRGVRAGPGCKFG